MLNGQWYLQPRIQFAFYAVAFVCFVVSALPTTARPGPLRRANLLAVGLAVAIAPSTYIYFKAGFHTGAFFH